MREREREREREINKKKKKRIEERRQTPHKKVDWNKLN